MVTFTCQYTHGTQHSNCYVIACCCSQTPVYVPVNPWAAELSYRKTVGSQCRGDTSGGCTSRRISADVLPGRPDDEFGEKSVFVLLDGEESEINFVDHPADEMSVENYLTTYEPHAFVVVFSVVERSSFQRAEEILQYLWRLNVMNDKGVILVANKCDIVRSRCVTEKEGSFLAESYDCKFIETSSGLNHKVDELLVGILKQIRLKLHNPEGTKDHFKKRSSRRKKYRGSKTSASLRVKSFLTKVCGKEPKSKSCENLHVL